MDIESGYRMNACVSLKFTHECSNPWCNSTWRWGLWGVIRLTWEWEPYTKINVLKERRNTRISLSSCPSFSPLYVCVRTQQKGIHLQTKKGVLTDTKSARILISNSLSLQMCNKFLLFKSPIYNILLQYPKLRQQFIYLVLNDIILSSYFQFSKWIIQVYITFKFFTKGLTTFRSYAKHMRIL